MTTSSLLVPLRVPELGPSLGKLITGTGNPAGGLALDAHRITLVTKIMNAAGEARRLAANGERGAALAALSAQVWLDAWEEAVSVVRRALVERIGRRLDEEAEVVRMPRRLRRRLALDSGETRSLAGRLGAAGAGLVPALDALEVTAGRVLDATVRDRAALDRWQGALVKAARRLEDAWIQLEEQVHLEAGEWERTAERVARWRRTLWPVVAVGAPALAAAVWLGLIIGGYVAAPGWLERVWALVF